MWKQHGEYSKRTYGGYTLAVRTVINDEYGLYFWHAKRNGTIYNSQPGQQTIEAAQQAALQWAKERM